MNKDTNSLENLIQCEQIILNNSKQKIIMPYPILSTNGQGVLYQNEICLVQGQTGRFKSMIIQILIALFLNKAFFDKDKCIGFDTNDSLKYIALIDTERNLSYRLPMGIQLIKRLINIPFENDIPFFSTTSMINMERGKRLSALENWLIHCIEKANSRHIICVIDILTDVINDFNNVTYTYQLIDLLVRYKEMGITFICSIHENPKSDRARGHSGTEMTNKASCVMKIDYEHENSEGTIQFLKTSLGKPPDDVYFSYADGVLVTAIPKKKFTEKDAKIIAGLFPSGTETFAHGELVASLQQNRYCGATQGKETIRKLVERKIIHQLADGRYALHPDAKTE